MKVCDKCGSKFSSEEEIVDLLVYGNWWKGYENKDICFDCLDKLKHVIKKWFEGDDV